MYLNKPQRLDIIENMLFEIGLKGTPEEVTLELIAKGVPPEYAKNLETAANNIYAKYGDSLLLILASV